jgi:hypothetical protein
MKRIVVAGVILTALGSIVAHAAEKSLTYTKLWTYSHGLTTTGQVSEVPAFDAKTDTVWVAGAVGVDILNATDGTLVDHIDVTSLGAINSVAIHNGLAALAVEAKFDRRGPGRVLFYDTQNVDDGALDIVEVGALPDMITFTHNGKKLLVANEGTPNAVADQPYALPDPVGSVSIIDVASRTVTATLDFAGVLTSGANLRTDFTPGAASFDMDFEPEYIAVDDNDKFAYVTLQEANAVAVLDLTQNVFTKVIGLGAKDFNQPGNEIDPIDNDGKIGDFKSYPVKGLYVPDGIATYKWRGKTYVVYANEGDYREDNLDRATGAPAPLNRLRLAVPDSTLPGGPYFVSGARSFSIRDAEANVVFDSGSELDREAHARGIYDDGRSRDKGVEPEGVALLAISGRTYAFIGLERTLKSAVAVYDVTDPHRVSFIDMIVTATDRAPEGLVAYRNKGRFFLGIANEAPGANGRSNTTLYELERVKIKE